MPSVFLSYRRADSPDTVKLLCERLRARLPRWQVFYDHQSIPPGEKFPERIRGEIAQATAVLVIMGPRWAELLRARQNDAVDHVLEEVRLALDSGNVVVPVLINRASLPAAADLGDLKPLLEHNALPIRPDPDFDGDLEVILDCLKQLAGSEAIGTTLADKYTLTAEIGAGGMGVVFAAQQKQPVQRIVAVKLVKPGMDSREVLARFDAERQALAVMDHANVAKVLDGGLTPSGRPFFVMEYVKGVPITQYCDDKKLTPRQRLELFIPVCNAVQHAHQKGIIHRDLKPSNVLVEVRDGKPVPKVIDFGLAKALGHKLTDMTLHTALDTRVGTLEYSSPEQAAGRTFEVDTRTDVYSLGILLYELLAGSPPFTHDELLKIGEDEMRRVIKETEPVKPSKRLSSSGELPALAGKRGVDPARLPKLVKGDLDWVVMKCLEKEPVRRYETANQLGEELQRYLGEQPVQAGPPSALYRWKKFLRRNRASVIAASLVILALLAGFIGTSVGLTLAKQAADREKLAAEKLFDVSEKEREHERREILQAEEKKRADERTAINVANAITQALELRRRGSFKQAHAALTQAESLLAPAGNPALRDRLRIAQEELEFVEELDRLRQEKGMLVKGKWRPFDAAPKYAAAFLKRGLDIVHGDETVLGDALLRSPLRDELLAALDDWLGLDGANRARLCELTARVTGQAWRRELLPYRWQNPQKLARILETVPPEHMPTALLVSICSQITKLGGDSTIWLDRARLRDPGDFWIWFELGDANGKKGNHHASLAAQAYYGCLAIRPDSSNAWNSLGVDLGASLDSTGAIFAFGEAIRLEPKNGLAYRNRAVSWLNEKEYDKAIKDFDEAIRLEPNHLAFYYRGLAWKAKKEYDQAIKDFDEAIRRDPEDNSAYFERAYAWIEKKEYDRAIKDLDEAIRLDPDFASAFINRGFAWASMKKYDQAIKDYDEAIRLDPKNTSGFIHRGYASASIKKYDQAIKDYDEAIRLDPKNALAFRNRGSVWYSKKEFDKAIADVDEAIRLDPKNALAFRYRGSAWYSKKEFDKAITDFDEAIRLDPKYAMAVSWRIAALAAARRCLEALAGVRDAQQKLPREAWPEVRFHAACATALAGCGAGDAARLVEKERQPLREQALVWLREELAHQEKLAVQSNAASRKEAIEWFQHVKQVSDFEGVRDLKALAQLPEAERERWLQFWQAVDAALKNAQALP